MSVTALPLLPLHLATMPFQILGVYCGRLYFWVRSSGNSYCLSECDLDYQTLTVLADFKWWQDNGVDLDNFAHREEVKKQLYARSLQFDLTSVGDGDVHFQRMAQALNIDEMRYDWKSRFYG